jgi:hypothetical protein
MSSFSGNKSTKKETHKDKQMILSSSSFHRPSSIQGSGLFPGLGFGAGFGPGLGFGFLPRIDCPGFDTKSFGGVFGDGEKGKWNAQVAIQVYGDVKIFTTHSDYRYDNDDQDQAKSQKKITKRKEKQEKEQPQEQEKETCGVCFEEYETAKTKEKGGNRAKRGRKCGIKTPRCCGKKNALCETCIGQLDGICPFCRGKLKF